jgi:hypothetical protein
MWIRELATGWERVYKPSEHASASVTRGTRDAVPTIFFPPHTSKESKRYSRNQQPHPPLILRPSRSPQACHLYFLTRIQRRPRVPRLPLSFLRNYLLPLAQRQTLTSLLNLSSLKTITTRPEHLAHAKTVTSTRSTKYKHLKTIANASRTPRTRQKQSALTRAPYFTNIRSTSAN